jgi:hypothetical protein
VVKSHYEDTAAQPSHPPLLGVLGGGYQHSLPEEMAKCSHGYLDVLWWKGCDLMTRKRILRDRPPARKSRHLGRGKRLQRRLSLTEPLRLYHSVVLAADRLMHAR